MHSREKRKWRNNSASANKKASQYYRDQKALYDEIEDYTSKESLVNTVVSISSQFTDLSPMERDFALKYVTEPRTSVEWAKYFNCHTSWISFMLNTPRVQLLMQKIQSEMWRYTLAKRMRAISLVQDFYIEVMETPTTRETIRSKMEVARDIMEGSKDAGDSKTVLNVSIGADQSNIARSINSAGQLNNRQDIKEIEMQKIDEELEELEVFEAQKKAISARKNQQADECRDIEEEKAQESQA